jgi:peptidoglycan/xylan/chitin deacetylase (PgdA/CDA1 family)
MNARQFIKNTYYSGLAGLGVHTRRIRKLGREDVVVLNFHRVSPDDSPYWPPMKPEIFDAVLLFLARNFQVCLFDELPALDDDRPAAVISFDDGYYDFLEHALPLLERHGLRGNMNVIPQCAETGRPIWNVRLYDFLAVAPRELVNEIRLPGFAARLSGNSGPEKLAFGLALSRFLKSLPREQRLEVWDGIDRLMQDLEFVETRMMTVDEIRQLAADTETEIGAHSFSHESMGLEAQDFFEDDFQKCSAFFRDELRIPMMTYAFPNGSYRPEQIEYLQAQGISNILLVDEMFAKRGVPAFPRLTMYGETRAEVEMRACGF